METILKFDRVILIKELNNKINKVGDAFEIVSVLDDAFVLKDANTKVTVGVIKFEDFEKHFVHEKNFKGWTNWTPLIGYDGQTDVLYRTNLRKVQVKFLTNNVRAESACHKADEFNLFFGVTVAYLRCLNKAMMKKKEEYENEINKIRQETADNENVIKRMINSLEV